MIASLLLKAFLFSHANVGLVEAGKIAHEVKGVMQGLLDDRGHEVGFTFGGNWQFDIRTRPRIGTNKYKILVSRGIYDHPNISKDLLYLLLCHEFGHLVGGQPYVIQHPSNPNALPVEYRKLSAEGQADFFSTASCMKRVTDKWSSIPIEEVPPVIAENCSKTFTDIRDQDRCIYLSAKSEEIAYVYYLIHQERWASFPIEMPSLDTPSTYESLETIQIVGEYPSVQCRLDTLAAGALCSEDECPELLQHPRPKCWFRE